MNPAPGDKSGMLSVVIACFNEEEVLPLTKKRLDQALANLDLRWEVVFVDDGSRDGSARLMREFARQDPHYRALILSRNYGHQVALTAGLEQADGDAVVVLDADLQDPPELIIPMVAKWREGYQVVYGQRTNRHGESWLKTLTAHLFYRVIRFLSGVDIPMNVGDFRLMDRVVVDAIKRMPEHFRFLRGMVAWAGFKQYPLGFERPARAAGTTKYPWRRMFAFALDAIFSFSVVPLRLATYVGLIVMTLSTLGISRVLYLRLAYNHVVPGYTSTMIALLFLGGLNLIILGIIGEYIGRIYVEIKGRPLYFIQEHVSAASR